MQIIVYGKGQVFERYKDHILWENVVAIADKKASIGEMYGDIPVIRPQDIPDVSCDYIAIFSNRLFEKIKNELVGEFFVPEEKIVSWRMIVNVENHGEFKCLEFCNTMIRQNGLKKILDVDMKLASHYLNKCEFTGTTVEIFAIGEKKYPVYRRIYQEFFATVESAKEIAYDLLILGDCSDRIKYLLDSLQSRYVVGYWSYDKLETSDVIKCKSVLESCGRLYSFRMAEGVIWLLDRRLQETLDSAKLFVVTHKKYNMPEDDLYVPFVVGEQYKDHHYLSEIKGDNIAYLNPKINECTALYWIWKNTDCEYVGLNHYRRRFYNEWNRNSGNYLDGFHLKEIFEEYDLVMAEALLCNGQTVREQLRVSVSEDAFEKGMAVVWAALGKHQPDYVEAFETVLQGHAFYICNMFVTRRQILNQYCEWLFSWLIEAAESIDVSAYGAYDKRIIGFLAERMWTVWLMKQDLRIKELPITEV